MKLTENEINFIEDNDVMVLSTYDSEGVHGAAIFYYFDRMNSDFYFLTKDKTLKHKKMLENNKVAITIYKDVPPETFQASGKVSIMDCKKDDCANILENLAEVHVNRKFWITPVDMLDKGELTFMKIKIDEFKYSKFES